MLAATLSWILEPFRIPSAPMEITSLHVVISANGWDAYATALELFKQNALESALDRFSEAYQQFCLDNDLIGAAWASAHQADCLRELNRISEADELYRASNASFCQLDSDTSLKLDAMVQSSSSAMQQSMEAGKTAEADGLLCNSLSLSVLASLSESVSLLTEMQERIQEGDFLALDNLSTTLIAICDSLQTSCPAYAANMALAVATCDAACGRVRRADQAVDQWLPVIRSIPDGGIAMINGLVSAAMVRTAAGKFDEARAIYLEIQAWCEKPHHRGGNAEFLAISGLTRITTSEADWIQSERFGRMLLVSALRSEREFSTNFAGTLLTAADASRYVDPVRAASLMNRAVFLLRRGDDIQLALAGAYCNIGGFSENGASDSLVLKRLRAAVEIYSRLLGPNSYLVNAAGANLAVVQWRVFGPSPEVEELLRGALACQTEDYVALLNASRSGAALGQLLADQGRTPEAADVLETAIAMTELMRERSKYMTIESRGLYFAYLKQSAYELMVDVQLCLAEQARAGGNEAAAGRHEAASLDYLEKSLARAALDLLESGNDPIPMAQKVRVRAVERGGEKSAQEFDRAEAEFGRAGDAVSSLEHQIAWWQNKLDVSVSQREAEIAQLAPQLAPARQALHEAAERRQQFWAQVAPDLIRLGEPASAAALRGLLSADERLLYYLVGESQGILLLVGRDGPLKRVELTWADDGTAVTSKSLLETVERYRRGLLGAGLLERQRGLEQMNSTAAARGDGAALSEGESALCELEDELRDCCGMSTTAEDLAPLLAEGTRLFEALLPTEIWAELRTCRRVYLVPNDPALNRLPFEALVVSDSPAPELRRYWIDADIGGPEIVYAPSGSYLIRAREKHAAQVQRRQSGVNDAMRPALLLGDPVFVSPTQVVYPAEGALVTAVTPGGPAQRLGVAKGDVLVRLADLPVADGAMFRKLLAGLQEEVSPGEHAGKTVPLTYWRPSTNAKETVSLSLTDQELGLVLAVDSPRESVRRQRAQGEAAELASRDRRRGASGELPRLPGTGREVRSIYEKLTGHAYVEEPASGSLYPKVLLREAATEHNLRDFFARPGAKARVLHLATHGLADVTGNTSYSSVALTMPAAEVEDDNGFLDLGDLLNRWQDKLDRCELVVLSACETQLGPQQRGDAVFALPLGFQYAGCPATIASLWQVDDARTAELMTEFYSQWLPAGRDADRSKSTLFWETRRSLRQKYPEPFFWAPFIYIGAPE